MGAGVSQGVQSRCLDYRDVVQTRGVGGQVEILRILGCLGLGWDPENLGVGGQVEILRILKCQRLGA